MPHYSRDYSHEAPGWDPITIVSSRTARATTRADRRGPSKSVGICTRERPRESVIPSRRDSRSFGGLSVTITTLFGVADASVRPSVRFPSADSADGGRRVGTAPSAGGAARSRSTAHEAARPRAPPATHGAPQFSQEYTSALRLSRARCWLRIVLPLSAVRRSAFGSLRSVQTRRRGYTVTYRRFFFYFRLFPISETRWRSKVQLLYQASRLIYAECELKSAVRMKFPLKPGQCLSFFKKHQFVTLYKMHLFENKKKRFI